MILQLQEELSRSRDVTRELRLRVKALEAELDNTRSSSSSLAGLAAAAAAGPSKATGYRRPAAADRWAIRRGGSQQHAAGAWLPFFRAAQKG